MTLPSHNFLTVHNDNKECVKLMLWNANKCPGKSSVEAESGKKAEEKKKRQSSCRYAALLACVHKAAALLHKPKKYDQFLTAHIQSLKLNIAQKKSDNPE